MGDRIDSAIIDRPSRFDRKYHFDLPTLDERTNYVKIWQERLADETGWQADNLESIAIACEGFSFAYLKELVISSVMKWMHDPSPSFASVVQTQAITLSAQMKTEPAAS